MEGTRAGVLFAGVGRKPFMPRKPLTRCAWEIRFSQGAGKWFSSLPPDDRGRLAPFPAGGEGRGEGVETFARENLVPSTLF